MTTKIAINGFGRIGRNILRAFSENPRNDLEIIAINDLGPVQTNAHLLKYDSVHSRLGAEIKITDNFIDIGHGPIAVTAIRNPTELPWKDVDIVLECTGFFTERATAAQHLENGAARVIVSAPCKDADKTIVYGVNHSALKDQDIVISNASCTTNCLAPVAQVLNDSIGLKRGFMTTIHSYTGDQPTLDTMHKDLYRARSAALNMIPTTTGAARAVGLVMPDLLGKLDGVSIRVPTPNVSCVDLTFEASRDTTINEINAAFEAAAAEGALKGVLGTTKEPLVSMDFNHDSRSSVVALDQTKVMEGTMCRILSWYDNEWGFSNRMLDTATQMAKFL